MLSCNLPEYSHPALFAHATHLLHILKQIFKKARCLVILSNCLYPLAGATIPSSKLTKKSSAIHHPLRATTIHCRGRSLHMKRIELAIQPPSGSVNMELTCERSETGSVTGWRYHRLLSNLSFAIRLPRKLCIQKHIQNSFEIVPEFS